MKLVLAVLLAAAPVFAQERRDPRVEAIVQRIDPARLQATVKRLTGFGTRHTLSGTQAPTSGHGTFAMQGACTAAQCVPVAHCTPAHGSAGAGLH